MLLCTSLSVHALVVQWRAGGLDVGCIGAASIRQQGQVGVQPAGLQLCQLDRRKMRSCAICERRTTPPTPLHTLTHTCTKRALACNPKHIWRGRGHVGDRRVSSVRKCSLTVKARWFDRLCVLHVCVCVSRRGILQKYRVYTAKQKRCTIHHLGTDDSSGPPRSQESSRGGGSRASLMHVWRPF